MIAFWALAGIMLLAAGALLLAPLLRGAGADGERARKVAALKNALDAGVMDRREHDAKLEALGAPQAAPVAKAPLAWIVALALLLPMGSIVLYRVVGEPRALDPAALAMRNRVPEGMPTDASGAPDLDKAVAGLAAKLEQNPEDADGWALLGRAYRSMNRFADARDALGKGVKLRPDDVDLKVEYAESFALATPGQMLEGEARTILDEALAAAPDHQRGLWLLGISEVQHERYAEGAAAWEKLLPGLPAEAPIRATVIEQLTEARKRAGLPPLDPALVAAAPPATPPAAPPTAPPTAPSTATPAGGAQLTVQIELAPELRARLAPSDVLFVFARAPVGPKMPLAIQRLPASQLPLTITLTDGMGMTPAMNLSSVPEVVVGARVSKSGNAAPQSGDFEVISAPVSTKTPGGPVKLVIASVVP